MPPRKISIDISETIAMAGITLTVTVKDLLPDVYVGKCKSVYYGVYYKLIFAEKTSKTTKIC